MSEVPKVGFWSWAQSDPDRLALVTPDGKEYTFGRILERSNRIAHGLRELGLKRGDGVAVLLGNEVEWIETILAATQVGLYFTPINYHLTGSEVAYILEDCEAKVFIAGEEYGHAANSAVNKSGFNSDHAFSTGKIEGFRPFAELWEGRSAQIPEDRSPGQSMLYTSGTTGQPKGVRRPLVEGAPEDVALPWVMLSQLFSVKIGDGTHLVTGPLYHAAPGAFAMAGLHLGHALIIMHKWTPEMTLELIDKHKVTTTHMVPTMFHRMLALPAEVRNRYDYSSLSNVIHGAAPCPVNVKHRMIEWWGPVLYEYYAATEGGGTYVTSPKWLENPGTVGRPLPGSKIVILDDNGNSLPPGEAGAVYMSSLLGNFEYFKSKEKTLESRKGDMFTVGDVGYLNDGGWLFLCDRKADLIISGGVNIYPAEIEAAFLTHPKVGDVAVFGIPDEEWGESVKAVVEPARGCEPGEELSSELLSHVSEKLAKYKRPRSIDFTDELPRQPSGKLYKRLLREKYWKGKERRI